MSGNNSFEPSKSVIQTVSDTFSEDSPFKIAEWPSRNDLRNSEESTPEKPLCSCFPLKKGSCMAGKHRTNRPNVSLIEYFVNELEEPNGKIAAANRAIITKDVTYRYQDVHDLSTTLALVLRPMLENILKTNTNPDGDVAISLCIPNPREKGIVAKLATLKLGCCFLPIDVVVLPPKRIKEIFQRLRPMLIIGTKNIPEFAEKLEPLRGLGFNVIALEDLWEEASDLRKTNVDLSSLILTEDFRTKPIALFYTPGGDGPEAVRIGNSAVWNRVMWEWETFPYSSSEVLVHQSSPYEIQSISELFVPLLAGKPILVTDALHLDSFLNAVRSYEVTRISTYPVLLRAMIITESLYKDTPTETYRPFQSLLEKIKIWICYRGTLRGEICQKFFTSVPSGTTLVQTFGVLECIQVISYKIYSSAKSVKDLEFYDVVPTEKPIHNTRIYIIDKELNIVKPGKLGEVCVAGVQLAMSYTGGATILDGTELEFIPNPFYNPSSDDPMYARLFKTGNFARILPGKKMCSQPTIVFYGRSEYHLIMNNLRATIADIFRQLREINEIVSCHVMVYRPCTSDQIVLAFVVVNPRKPITTEEIMDRLRVNLPEYIIPLVILVDGFPIGKNFQIDHQALMQLYFDDRQEKLRFEGDGGLKLKTPEEIRAGKVFCTIMYNVTGTKLSTISEHMNWPVSKLRVRFSNTPLIILMLKKNGYFISFDEFLETKSVRELIQTLASRREKIAEAETRKWTGMFVAEPITSGMYNDISKLFIHSLSSYYGFQSVSFYAGIKEKDMKDFFHLFWDLLMSEPFSIAIRHAQTKEFVGAALNIDFVGKTKSQMWANASAPIKYRLSAMDNFDSHLTRRVNFHKSDSCLSTAFVLVNAKYFENFDASLQMIESLFEPTIKMAKKNNYSHTSAITFDYSITSVLVDILGYEVLQRVQLNTLMTEDGKRPFKLAPDYMDVNFLIKALQSDHAAKGDSSGNKPSPSNAGKTVSSPLISVMSGENSLATGSGLSVKTANSHS